MAMLLLVACAESPKRTLPPKKPLATKPTVSAPVQPVSKGMALVDPGNHEQEKSRIKAQLSKGVRDSLPASEVGYYMDVLQASIKKKVGNNRGIGIARSNDRIVIVMTGASGFDGVNHKISPGTRSFLAPLSKVLVEYRMTLVSVRIRADSSDGRAGNPQLTEQRTQSVARFLLDNGVAVKRMVVVGAARSSANSTSGSRERIELQIEPVVRSTDG